MATTSSHSANVANPQSTKRGLLAIAVFAAPFLLFLSNRWVIYKLLGLVDPSLSSYLHHPAWPVEPTQIFLVTLGLLTALEAVLATVAFLESQRLQDRRKAGRRRQ